MNSVATRGIKRLKSLVRRVGLGHPDPWEKIRWNARGPSGDSRNLDVLFSVRNHYQIKELTDVNQILTESGVRTGFLDHTLDAQSLAAQEARSAGLPVSNLHDFASGRLRPTLLVIRTDSDKCSRKLLDHSSAIGVTTMALAHPLINFRRKPNQYKMPDYVLCVGRYTADRLRREDVDITGFPYFDQFMRQPQRSDRSDRVVVNVALPRGLGHVIPQMNEYRIKWVNETLDASRALGLDALVSVHPRDTLPQHDWPIQTGPIEPYLIDAAVVVSPPSTVIYTAMAMGTPVACHQCPPVRQRMPGAFDEPLGAFQISENLAGLTESIDDATSNLSDYRTRSEAFFLHHVSVDPKRSMTQRTTDALMRQLERSR